MLFAPNSQLAKDQQQIVIVERGMDVVAISTRLHETKVIQHPRWFTWTAKFLGYSNELKAGRYEFTGGQNTISVLQQLKQGKVSSIRVTIPEGLQSKQIASILARELSVDSLKIMELVHDSSFVHSLGVPSASLEGFIYPNTYFFYWGQNEKELLSRLVHHFFTQVSDSILKRMQDMDMTLVETVTLASIIQGEAMVTEEMPLISAVYHNRLDKGMYLQADPTLQFIVPDGPRRLTIADKEIASPYNTYLHTGLPPGPINNPGIDAIRAAITPARVPYLYFVANGDGTHTFSRTLQEHLRAKRRFDKIRREVYSHKNKQEKGGKNK